MLKKGGYEFADLTEIRGDKEYQSEIGAKYYGDDGKLYTV